MIRNKRVWVYDIECLSNLFTCTFLDRDSDDIKSFYIHPDDPNLLNNITAFHRFCREQVKGGIGFNNVEYDYPVLHYFINTSEKDVRKYAADFPARMYARSQEVIRPRTKKEKYEVRIGKRESYFVNRDLYLLNHYDNHAKRTSLKDLEVRLKMDNVQDMPYEHWEEIPFDAVPAVMEYNLNDVIATKQFYLVNRPKIKMRHVLSNKYGVNMRNYNDPKMGETIVLHRIAQKKNISTKEVKKLRTPVRALYVRDIILPEVNFRNTTLQAALARFQNLVVQPSKNADGISELVLKGTLDLNIVYDGMNISFGMGGIHAARSQWDSRKYLNRGYKLTSIDVKSYYPRLAVSKKIYPEHLSEDFCIVYDEMYNERTLYPKGTPENYGLKIALNGTFGKMADTWSWLKDYHALAKITINGQLLLTMLAEDITDAGMQVIMMNTDGMEILHTEEQRPILERLVREWEAMTDLEMEAEQYAGIFIRDVNNYFAQSISGEIKAKGAYQFKYNDDEYHKDQSMVIVAKAVRNYFMDNTPIQQSIHEADPYDLLKMVRINKDAVFILDQIEMTDHVEVPLQRTVRYFVADTAAEGPNVGWLRKKYIGQSDSKEKNTKFEGGQKVYIMNTMEHYDQWRFWVNKQYYYREAMKLVRGIESMQTSLI